MSFETGAGEWEDGRMGGWVTSGLGDWGEMVIFRTQAVRRPTVDE